jgi:hypothetical protein
MSFPISSISRIQNEKEVNAITLYNCHQNKNGQQIQKQ